MGAWIETRFGRIQNQDFPESHPSWVRGLKPSSRTGRTESGEVAPFMGAWIETMNADASALPIYGRTLHGCVD